MSEHLHDQTSPSPVPARSPQLVVTLKGDLLAAQWNIETINSLLSPMAQDALMRDQCVPAIAELSKIAEDHPLFPCAALTQLFMLGQPLTQRTLDLALPTLGSAGALGLGLISEDADGTFRALFDLRPHEASLPTAASFTDPGRADERETHRWWVLSDLGEVTTGQPLHKDHVLGIGGATMSLLALTSRRPAVRALDIGTGCGIQALYLATHCEKVVATDISQRAVDITEFNATLNETHIDVRLGSLFEPVEGERFDLIVSNPPFVITPNSLRGEGVMEYRDGGMERDTLIGTIIRSAPNYLVEGGVMHMLGNWEILADSDPHTQWSRRVEQWLDGLPLNAWVLQRDLLDPAQYVEMWIRDSGGNLQPRAKVHHTYSEWIDDFSQAKVAYIGLGSMTLQRVDTAPPQRRFDYLPEGNPPTGADAERALRTLTLPHDIWERPLRRASDVTEERHYLPGSPDPTVILMRQGGGLGHAIRVGSNTSAFIGACDGELTAGQIVNAISIITDQQEQQVREEVASLLPDLLMTGMLNT